MQETQRVPIKKNPKRPTSRHIIIKMAKFQEREKPEGSKGKTGSNIQGSPNEVSSYLLNGKVPSQKRIERNIPSNENQSPPTKTTLSTKALNKSGMPNKDFLRQKKKNLKEYPYTHKL